METTFDTLSDDARVWVFGAVEPIEPVAAEGLLASLSQLLKGWSAHGAPVLGAATILEGRFVVTGAGPELAQVSGCSIDALFRGVREACAQAGLTMSDPSQVFFRAAGRIVSCSRAEFQQLVRAGEVTANTEVFDLTVSTKLALKTQFVRKFQESWHAQAFGAAASG